MRKGEYRADAGGVEAGRHRVSAHAAVPPQVSGRRHARTSVTHVEAHPPPVARHARRILRQASSERRQTGLARTGHGAGASPFSPADVPLPGRVCRRCGEWFPHACTAPDGDGPGGKRGAAQAAAWLVQQALACRYRAAATNVKPARTAAAPASRRARRSRAVVTEQRPDRRLKWLLPDDGELDELNVRRAAHGTPVRLTRPERTAAARLIVQDGGGPSLLSLRLHMNGTCARRLYEQVAGRPPGPAGIGYRDRVPA